MDPFLYFMVCFVWQTVICGPFLETVHYLWVGAHFWQVTDGETNNLGIQLFENPSKSNLTKICQRETTFW